MLGRQIERRGKGLEREDKSTMDIDSIIYVLTHGCRVIGIIVLNVFRHELQFGTCCRNVEASIT